MTHKYKFKKTNPPVCVIYNEAVTVKHNIQNIHFRDLTKYSSKHKISVNNIFKHIHHLLFIYLRIILQLFIF